MSKVEFTLTMFFWNGRMCKVEFNQDQSHINVDKRLPKEFADWFKKR